MFRRGPVGSGERGYAFSEKHGGVASRGSSVNPPSKPEGPFRSEKFVHAGQRRNNTRAMQSRQEKKKKVERWNLWSQAAGTGAVTAARALGGGGIVKGENKTRYNTGTGPRRRNKKVNVDRAQFGGSSKKRP